MIEGLELGYFGSLKALEFAKMHKFAEKKFEKV